MFVLILIFLSIYFRKFKKIIFLFKLRYLNKNRRKRKYFLFQQKRILNLDELIFNSCKIKNS